MTLLDKLPTDRALQLTHLFEVVDAAAIMAAARAIDARRDDAIDAQLIAHHRFAIPGLTTTPFMHQAAVIARERGVVAFNRLERAFLPPSPRWVHPEIGADYYRTRIRGEQVEAQNLWPFAQDCPASDFQVNIAPKWLTHGLVHTLVGFGWWDGLSEWDVMHMARLSEAIAALHWYWLAELGRFGDDSPPIDLSVLNAAEAAQYIDLETSAVDPEVRARHLNSERGLAIAENGLQIFQFEAFAHSYGMAYGVLIEPQRKSLAFGEACEYAKVHHRRLTSPSFRRWLEVCLRPDIDYATTAQGFDQRVAEIFVQLLTPQAPAADVSAARADQALRDIGQRVCHLAALRDDATDGFNGVLTAISDALGAIRTGHDDPDGVVAEVMERVARDVDQPEGGIGPREVLALGYCPLTDPDREPALAKASRAEALVHRAWALHKCVGATVEGLKPLAARVVDGARTNLLTEELRAHADPAAREEVIDYFSEAWVGWVDFLRHHWGPADGRDNLETRWQYRLSRRTLPPEGEWAQYVVVINPYLQKMPLPFNSRWVEQLLAEPRGRVQPLQPRNQTAVEYGYVGPGRHGPVFEPLTPRLNGLMLKLKLPLRLDALIAHDDIDADRVRRALDDELLLCFHKPEHEVPEWMERRIDFIDMAGVVPREETSSDSYWTEPRQVTAYESFCAHSTLYSDSSRELIERIGLSAASRVADLGSGTGITTRAALARLGPEGVVVGADPSELMVKRARELTDDKRARFIVGGAQQLGVEAARETPFDRAICNSALWLTQDIERDVARLRNSMTDDGVFGFSIPAAFLGHTDHLTTPEFVRFGEAVVAVRAAMDHNPEAVPLSSDPAIGDTKFMQEVLQRCAFKDVDFQLWSYPWSVSEYIDWLSMPVVREGMVPPDKKAEAERFIELLREQLDPDMPLENRWYFVMARATL